MLSLPGPWAQPGPPSLHPSPLPWYKLSLDKNVMLLRARRWFHGGHWLLATSILSQSWGCLEGSHSLNQELPGLRPVTSAGLAGERLHKLGSPLETETIWSLSPFLAHCPIAPSYRDFCYFRATVASAWDLQLLIDKYAWSSCVSCSCPISPSWYSEKCFVFRAIKDKLID